MYTICIENIEDSYTETFQNSILTEMRRLEWTNSKWLKFEITQLIQ